MPEDPAALDNRAEGLVLTAADLLHSIAVKLPPFWLDNIKTWLIQSKSQFRLKGVTVLLCDSSKGSLCPLVPLQL